MGFIGNQVIASTGDLDLGGWLRFKCDDDLGVAEVHIDGRYLQDDGTRITSACEPILVDIDELLAVVTEFHARAKALQPDTFIRTETSPVDVPLSDAVGAPVLSVVPPADS